MNDETLDDTLFDSSGSHDFIRWRAKSDTMFYTSLKLQVLFDLPQSRFWSENHGEYHPFLKIFHIYKILTVLKWVTLTFAYF